MKSTDNQMINTETMFEYYHLLTLSNGTILDIAAGRAGFLTEPSPISKSGDAKEMEWPAVISLESPRQNNTKVDEDEDEYGMRRYNQGPDCVSLLQT